jgi:hypothetical protein
MISGAFWFAVMTATVRHLSQDMDIMQIVLFRNAFALLFPAYAVDSPTH